MQGLLAANLAILLLAFFTIVGDVGLKESTHLRNPFTSWQFILGFLIYAAGAFGWYFAMKHLPLVAVGVIYTSFTLIALAAIGHFWYNEPLGGRQLVAIALAAAAFAVIEGEELYELVRASLRT